MLKTEIYLIIISDISYNLKSLSKILLKYVCEKSELLTCEMWQLEICKSFKLLYAKIYAKSKSVNIRI